MTKNKSEVLSIVIVTYNSSSCISACLESIYNDPVADNCEIILVDNASTDDTAELVKKRFPYVIVIANERNNGFAKANNQGIDIANGQYVLLLNPDVVILDNCLSMCRDYMDSLPQVGMCGCKIFNPDRTLQYSMRDFPSIWNAVCESLFLYKLFPGISLFSRYYGTELDYTKQQDANVLLGAFLLIRKSALEETGNLDEQFFIYSEETDFCRRMKESQWRVMYYPEAEIIHFGGSSTSQVRVPMAVFLHKSQHQYAKKHLGFRGGFFKCVMFWGVCLRMILWSFVRLFSRKSFVKNRLNVNWNLFLWYLKIKNPVEEYE